MITVGNLEVKIGLHLAVVRLVARMNGDVINGTIGMFATKVATTTVSGLIRGRLPASDHERTVTTSTVKVSGRLLTTHPSSGADRHMTRLGKSGGKRVARVIGRSGKRAGVMAETTGKRSWEVSGAIDYDV